MVGNSTDALVLTSLHVDAAGTVIANGAPLLFEAPIDNTGSTLTLPGTGLLSMIDLAGTITGGTVVNPGTALDTSGATLQNLLWRGGLSANTGTLIAADVTVQALDGSQYHHARQCGAGNRKRHARRPDIAYHRLARWTVSKRPVPPRR